MVWIITLGFLIVLALIMGFRGCREVTMAIEVNTFQSPFYKLGVFSDRHSLEDGSVEDEVVIGLLFVNVVVVFWKPVD